MWGFLSALISGALMSIQGVFNTNVTKQTSLWVSTGWVQFSAFLVCVAAWFFTGRDSVGDFRCGKSRFSVEKAVGNADLYCRCGYFQMEIEIKVL